MHDLEHEGAALFTPSELAILVPIRSSAPVRIQSCSMPKAPVQAHSLSCNPPPGENASPPLISGKWESSARDAKRGLVRVCVLVYALTLVHLTPPHVPALVTELKDALQVEQKVHVLAWRLNLHQKHLLCLRSKDIPLYLLPRWRRLGQTSSQHPCVSQMLADGANAWWTL